MTDKFRKRTGYTASIDDDQAAITIFRPLSGEYLHNGQYLVIYEDAQGILGMNTFTKEQISSTYNILEKDLEQI